jgi:hypothetical protein
MSRFFVMEDDNLLGSVITDRSMTDEEICEAAGVELAISEEDFNGMPENGKHDLEDLTIEPESYAVFEEDDGKRPKGYDLFQDRFEKLEDAKAYVAADHRDEKLYIAEYHDYMFGDYDYL